MDKITAYLQTKPEFLYATVGYLLRADEILLGVRKQVTSGLGEQIIAGIGGKLESGESDAQALQRECAEEINVAITSYALVGHATYLIPHKPQWNQKVSIYVVDGWTGEPQETEAIQPVWFKQHELPKHRMWPDNLYTIPRALNGRPFEGTFLYGADGTIDEYTVTDLPAMV